MTFLNATLIFGALAAGVPIVLHLIAKKEPRREVFPAIRFLTKKFDTNRTRLKVKRWWLLLLRVLALIALAASLARPTIHRDLSIAWLSIGLVVAAGVAMLVLATLAIARGLQKRTAIGLAVVGGLLCFSGFGWGGYTLAAGERAEVSTSSPMAVAIVIDNAAVSAWVTPSGSHLQRMQDRAKEVLRSLPPTSRAAIVDRSGRAPAFAVDFPAAISQVDQLLPRQLVAPVESRLRSASRLLGTSDLKSKFLIVITNSSVSSWTPPPAETIDNKGMEVVVINVGQFNGTNRRLELGVNDLTPPKNWAHPLEGSVTVDSNPVGGNESTDSGTSVQVELRLYGDDPSKPVIRNGELVLPDSQVVDRVTLQVTPGTRSEFVLRTPPLDEGLHHLSLRFVGTDALAIDDRRAITLLVEKPPRLLIVADDRSKTDLVACAITAPRLPGDPDAEFAVDEVTFDELRGLRLEDYASIFLIDPPISVIQDDGFHSFVLAGGSCFVSLGPSFQPGAITEGVVAKRIWRVPDEGSFFQALRANHPILAPLEQGSSPVRWSDFRVRKYWQFENRDDVPTLLQWTGTNHPALFSIPEGDGQWLVLTTPLTTNADSNLRWNDLLGTDAWPTIMLIRQFGDYLARPNRASTNTLVGSPITLTIAAQEPSQPATEDDSTVRWQLFAPESVRPVPIRLPADDSLARISETSVAGTYWLRSRNQNVGFSANLPADSVVARQVGTEMWDDWFGPDGYQRVSEVPEIDFVSDQQQVAVSLRSPALLLAMAVFLFEQLLGNRFYQSSQRTVPKSRAASGWLANRMGAGARST